MLRGKQVTAIIPARGGSKGIPKKNLYTFGKYSLLERTIQIALKSIFVDKLNKINIFGKIININIIVKSCTIYLKLLFIFE